MCHSIVSKLFELTLSVWQKKGPSTSETVLLIERSLAVLTHHS